VGNRIDVTLDVLASSPKEINAIEAALQQPRERLLAYAAKRWREDPKHIAADLKTLVTFKPTRNLGYRHPNRWSLHKWRIRMQEEGMTRETFAIAGSLHIRASQKFR
jgi:hypothetical protein